jgi:D-sedoheptulose 7-phosphate isomerase
VTGRPPSLEALLDRRPELRPVGPQLDRALGLLLATFDRGGTLFVGGNGGSASDAEHIVGELMKGMVLPRSLSAVERHELVTAAPADMADDAAYLADRLQGALRSVCLTSQTSLISAVANDIAGDMTMAQQVHGYGRPGDALWAISTSGSSRNVVLAALVARGREMTVLALTGDPGEPLARMADVAVRVPASQVAAVQELHLAAYHALCEALEEHYFSSSS